MTEHAISTQPAPLSGQLFIDHLLERLRTRYTIKEEFIQRVAAELQNRITPPKRLDWATVPPVERLKKENINLLKAFRNVLISMPKDLNLGLGAVWDEATLPLPGEAMGQATRALLEQLESRLGDHQLALIYAGAVTFFDQRLLRNQSLPVNWEGLRYRLLAAAMDDITPRSHLNYFCSCGARIIEILAERGYPRAELRLLVDASLQEMREGVQAEMRAATTAHFQHALNELFDDLREIHHMVGEIVHNARESLGDGAAATLIALSNTVTGYQERQSRLSEVMKQMEGLGVEIPPGLHARLRLLLETSRGVINFHAYLETPSLIQEFWQRIGEAKKLAQAVAFEFRRIRRRTKLALRQVDARIGRLAEEIKPRRIRHQVPRILLDAAMEALWSLKDVGHVLTSQETRRHPVLSRLHAAVQSQEITAPIMLEMERVMKERPLNHLHLRLAGRKLLQIILEMIQLPLPPEISRDESYPLAGALGDLVESHRQLSLAVEGEEWLKLANLPPILMELHRAVGLIDPGKVIHVGVTAALEREQRCRQGEFHLAMTVRLDNLLRPLKELVKASYELGVGTAEMREARNRALHILDVTHEVDPLRGKNYLAELVVAPLLQLFLPQDPRLGRAFSEVERRLRDAPVPGILPGAMLFGVRQVNSLEGLGNPKFSEELHHRARLLVNHSGLVGEVLGLHPLWENILESDETQSLIAELRPLFAGSMGRGVLLRIINGNEEYFDLNRLDEEEKLREGALLLEALTSPDGLAALLSAIFELACLLSSPALEVELRRNRRLLLFDQRELLRTLNLEAPTELLRPLEEWRKPGRMEPLLQLLEELNEREQELTLLQLHHRKFFSPHLLGMLLKTRFGSYHAMEEAMPQLAMELKQRFQWLSHHPGLPGEREAARTLLVELGYARVLDTMDAGLAQIKAVQEEMQRLRLLRQEQPRGIWDKLRAFLQGDSRRSRELAQKLRRRIEQIRLAGLEREARLLAEEIRPLLPTAPAK